MTASIRLRCLTILITLMLGASALGDDLAPEATKWVLPIATPQESEDLTPRLKKLKEVLNNQFVIQYQQTNPVCAFWVEITRQSPRPDAGGYVMIIQDGCVRLLATDLEQLDHAIARLKKVRIVKPDGVYLPIGLLTNYRLIDAQQTEMAK
ncbi:hypothetical protein GC197_00635 [bacterium]|nr:hypothetical protein [bacterium]